MDRRTARGRPPTAAIEAPSLHSAHRPTWRHRSHPVETRSPATREQTAALPRREAPQQGRVSLAQRTTCERGVPTDRTIASQPKWRHRTPGSADPPPSRRPLPRHVRPQLPPRASTVHPPGSTARHPSQRMAGVLPPDPVAAAAPPASPAPARKAQAGSENRPGAGRRPVALRENNTEKAIGENNNPADRLDAVHHWLRRKGLSYVKECSLVAGLGCRDRGLLGG